MHPATPERRYPDRMAVNDTKIPAPMRLRFCRSCFRTILCLLLPGVLAFSCTAGRVGSRSGISGSVLWLEGNLMPGFTLPGRPADAAGRPVRRKIYIYELVARQQAAPSPTTGGSLYGSIGGRLVKKVNTGAGGRFRVSLPPGRYSLFTAEQDGFFCNIRDAEDHLCPVEVNTGQFTEVRIEINYRAYY
jgi:hypothetical protein